MTICQNSETPIKMRPSANTPMTKAPMIVPPTPPRPPMSEVPPSTTAAIALKLERFSGRRMSRIELRGDDQPDGSRAPTRNDVSGALYPLHADAGEFGRALVAAHGIDAAPEGRAFGEEHAGGGEQQHEPDGSGNPEQRARTERGESGIAEFGLSVQVGKRRAIGDEQRGSPRHVKRARVAMNGATRNCETAGR